MEARVGDSPRIFQMKVLKSYPRTFETIGEVVFEADDTLPAFLSFIEGKLVYLRFGKNINELHDNVNCLEYDLTNIADQFRLAKTDIVEIRYPAPMSIELDRQKQIREWRDGFQKEAEQKPPQVPYSETNIPY